MSRSTYIRSGVIIAIAMIGMSGSAQTQHASTGLQVIELFTSQGCNSCPPADALLGELAQRPDVLALAFHVDYWDDLGWRDRFALPLSAARQRHYVQALGLSGGFTPQAVIDGRRSVLGSDRRSITAALGNEHHAMPMQLAPIQLAIVGNTLSVVLGQQPLNKRVDVNLVAYLPTASTAIGRGENSGRTLNEFNIVRAFKQLGTWDGSAREFTVPLTSLPAEASKVAVLIQAANQGAIAGASSISIR